MAARWYVVKVPCGREAALAAALPRLAEHGEVGECFSPKWRTQRKARGAWEGVERLLLPGYVIAEAEDPDKLHKACSAALYPARILRDGKGSFTPLPREEAAWIGRHAAGPERVVPMSRAVKVGDEVVVLDGPLKDRWLEVSRIDRRRSTAYLRIDLCGRPKEVPVGLAVVAKQDLRGFHLPGAANRAG